LLLFWNGKSPPLLPTCALCIPDRLRLTPLLLRASQSCLLFLGMVLDECLNVKKWCWRNQS
jgi:hypothetical protein